jgi:hypothetical protein
MNEKQNEKFNYKALITNLPLFTLPRETSIAISELFNDIRCNALPWFLSGPLRFRVCFRSCEGVQLLETET